MDLARAASVAVAKHGRPNPLGAWRFPILIAGTVGMLGRWCGQCQKGRAVFSPNCFIHHSHKNNSTSPSGGIKNSFRLTDVTQLVVVPLPPLAEQRRIVAKVDELRALCDRKRVGLAAARLVSAIAFSNRFFLTRWHPPHAHLRPPGGFGHEILIRQEHGGETPQPGAGLPRRIPHPAWPGWGRED